ncbi:hypothetical protein EV138_4146 [Kribbella voronezhensis]|uniref:Fibronectin type-III domain-containing protein n=1 Tax=Kribbella voronezhensis TaxID=2512212 RepID=A0A4R7TEI3_9ACTN|nr:hypothetical protein [Kribbella voronezhensis]TDU90555.1 hypothetical protein EV138_4146 [Kribbella voronezhensis]
MKRIAAVLPAVLLAAGLAAPAAAAEEPAPTNVKIAWKDSTLKDVHVTWDEATPQPNVLYYRAAGSSKRYLLRYLAADAPNEADIAAVLLPRQLADAGTDMRLATKEIGVAVGTREAETSPMAVSPAFDTLGPTPAKLESFTMSGTNGMLVKWSGGALAAADETPGDPLDQPGAVRFQPRYYAPDSNSTVDLGQATEAKQLSFTAPAERIGFYVVATNEWSTAAAGAQVAVRPGGVKATIPTWMIAHYGATIKGTATPTPYLRPAILQARNSSTSAWYVVGSTETTGDIEFQLEPFFGTRQYRLAVPNYATADTAYFGAYSAPGTLTVQQFGYASPLEYDGHVVLGQSTIIYLNLYPPVNGTAAFQRWNGKTWVGAGSLPFKNGHAEGRLRGTALGRVAYRYYIPANTYNGLPVAAAYTKQFVITTIR